MLSKEPGAEQVRARFRQAASGEIDLAMSVINLGEVAYIVERRWGRERMREILAYLDTTKLQIFEATRVRTLAAAHIKANHALSYADAFAAALALTLDATLITGDPEFQTVSGEISIEWLPAPDSTNQSSA